MVNHFEIIMQLFYKYIFCSPKIYLKLVKLGEVMEIQIWRSWTMSISVGFLCWTHSYRWCKSIIHYHWKCHQITLQSRLLHSTWKIVDISPKPCLHVLLNTMKNLIKLPWAWIFLSLIWCKQCIATWNVYRFFYSFEI